MKSPHYVWKVIASFLLNKVTMPVSIIKNGCSKDKGLTHFVEKMAAVI